MKIFIVIPAYNEEDRIKAVIENIKKTKCDFPIVVIDDGSKDNTGKVAKKLGLIVLEHKINLGKGAALRTGCDYAFKNGADAVILMDSDGQHKADDLVKFIGALNKGSEVVFGSRNYNNDVPLVRYLGNKFASVMVASFFRIYISDILCGFKAFTKKAYKKLRWGSSGYSVETEIAVLTGKNKLSFCQVPIATVYYDAVKGVTILDAVGTFFDLIYWRIKK
jgi:glycosyltransferase involved in cell wall biosynthesis